MNDCGLPSFSTSRAIGGAGATRLGYWPPRPSRVVGRLSSDSQKPGNGASSPTPYTPKKQVAQKYVGICTKLSAQEVRLQADTTSRASGWRSSGPAGEECAAAVKQLAGVRRSGLAVAREASGGGATAPRAKADHQRETECCSLAGY